MWKKLRKSSDFLSTALHCRKKQQKRKKMCEEWSGMMLMRWWLVYWQSMNVNHWLICQVSLLLYWVHWLHGNNRHSPLMCGLSLGVFLRTLFCPKRQEMNGNIFSPEVEQTLIFPSTKLIHLCGAGVTWFLSCSDNISRERQGEERYLPPRPSSAVSSSEVVGLNPWQG